MHPILRNILAVIAGFIVYSLVMSGILQLGIIIIPKMLILDTKYFVLTFLSHALGTFFASAVAAWIAASHKMKIAISISLFFLAAGIITVTYMIPAPTWFVVVDLVFAYIPMAWIGGKLVTRNTSKMQITN